MTTATAPAQTPAPGPGRPVARGPVAWRLIHAELRKMWTTNAWWIFAVCALAMTALALLVNVAQAGYEIDSAVNPPDFGIPPGENVPPEMAEQQREQQEQWAAEHQLADVLRNQAANIYTSGQFFGLLFVLLIGTIMVTNEFAHQTATATFLATPRRTQVILAKLAAAVGIAAAFWFFTTLVDLGVGALYLDSKGYASQLGLWSVQRAIVFNLLAYAIWAVLGVGLGTLIRSQIGATVTGAALYLPGTYLTIIAFYLIHQYLIKQDWVLDAMVLAPSLASSVMISPGRPPSWPGEDSPAWWVGLIVMIGWGLLAGVIGTLITRRRDIS